MDKVVDKLIEVMSVMEACAKSDSINALNKNIKTFLIANCVHDVETDYIDTSPEQSQQICYCKKCNLMLNPSNRQFI